MLLEVLLKTLPVELPCVVFWILVEVDAHQMSSTSFPHNRSSTPDVSAKTISSTSS
jgi:hypothetical protein